MLKLVFTPQEKRAFLFILATFLLGAALRLVHYYRLQAMVAPLDSLDRVFLARAGALTAELETESASAGSNSGSDTLTAGSPVSGSPVSGTPASGTPATGTPVTGTPVTGKPLDLNVANAVELESLPGIGPVLARRIVEYRQRRGPFKTVDDLLQVRGIGARSLAKLRQQVVVLPAVRDSTRQSP